MKCGRSPSPSISLLLLMIIVIGWSPGLSFGQAIAIDEGRRWLFESSIPAKWNSDTVSPSQDSGEEEYWTSKRSVPEGPNPLHN
ncbi:hypothetical protein QJS10_CPB18g01507 [Acorus calamus]|uniref:Uncharacterized protein n=1 Tax=Acorus calamus TaxID=4465 RepID=A0AAV9CN18_ACOCL|nr:hypothetical protein QJS10_CPB18g01507 [Acorus calamus]